MGSSGSVEHYATLFDRHFLLQGLCLYRSLAEHAGAFHLWILCVDDETERAFGLLNLPGVTLIRLRDAETPALAAAKAGRSIGEYCWTLTPFIPDFVFARDPAIKRVTYVDSDLYLLGSPSPIFEEFEQSARHVLITEHAYAPEYAFQQPEVGRFCVQFMTFRNSEPARKVSSWWQERCLEWCFARAEDGKFGDQKYLDDWPERFPSQVHVLRQVEKTLAPWNALHFEQLAAGELRPIMFHFQGLRIHPGRRVTLYAGYRIGTKGLDLYAQYLHALKLAALDFDGIGIRPAALPQGRGLRATLIRFRRLLSGTERHAALQ